MLGPRRPPARGRAAGPVRPRRRVHSLCAAPAASSPPAPSEGGAAEPRPCRAQRRCGHFSVWGPEPGPGEPGGRPAGQRRRGPVHGGERGAAASAAFPLPPPRLGGGSGGAPAGPVSPSGLRRRPQGQARPATARGAAAGGQGAGGAGRARCRRRLLPLLPLRGGRKAAGPGPTGSGRGSGEGRASALLLLPLPALRVGQPSAVGVGGGARRPGEGPGPAASLGDGVRQRGSAAGRWPVAAAAAAAETACFWKVRARLPRGETRPALRFWRAARGAERAGGRGQAGACVAVRASGPRWGPTTMRGAPVAWGKGGCRQGWLHLVKRDLLRREGLARASRSLVLFLLFFHFPRPGQRRVLFAGAERPEQPGLGAARGGLRAQGRWAGSRRARGKRGSSCPCSAPRPRPRPYLSPLTVK